MLIALEENVGRKFLVTEIDEPPRGGGGPLVSFPDLGKMIVFVFLAVILLKYGSGIIGNIHPTVGKISILVFLAYLLLWKKVLNLSILYAIVSIVVIGVIALVAIPALSGVITWIRK
jgi:hypothetical protein